MNAFTPGGEDDLDAIRAELRARTEDVALELLGQPNRKLSRGKEWRWNRKGSVEVTLSGRDRGLCRDFAANEGGDLFWLIRRETGSSFPEAVSWARGFLRMPEPLSRPGTEAKRTAQEARRKAQAEKRAREQARREAEAASDEAQRTAKARKLAADAVPADGTPADTYLTKWRRIPRPAGGWPDAVRYHRGRHALLVVATDDAGDVRAVQLVHLAADARKLAAEEAQTRNLPGAKQTFGVMAGAVVRLPGTDGALLVAEGPETALSVWAATGMATWATCGPTNRIAPPPAPRPSCAPTTIHAGRARATRSTRRERRGARLASASTSPGHGRCAASTRATSTTRCAKRAPPRCWPA